MRTKIFYHLDERKIANFILSENRAKYAVNASMLVEIASKGGCLALPYRCTTPGVWHCQERVERLAN
jgi:uncharacterized protein YhbP (UPF0306 family)